MEKVKDVLEEAKSEIERVKQLSTTNEALRTDCNEKLAKLEGQNAQVLLSLDEAQETDKEQLIVIALTDEPENLKKIVSAVQEKCLEAKYEGKEMEKSFISSSEIKDHVIEKLKKELEECHSSLTMLKLQNEELSFKLRSMRSEFSEASLGQQTEDKNGDVTRLLEQLEIKKSSLAKVQNELDRERKEKRTLLEELNSCKELLDEYSEKQLSLMEQAAKLTDELQVAHVVLERVDSKLTDKTYERSELELELEVWRSLAERMQTQLEESKAIRRKLEATLLAQAQVAQQPKRDAKKDELMISNLEQHITLFNQDYVGAEENAKDDIEKASRRSKSDGDDQREQELLAGELEEAILAHIMKEKKYTKLSIMLELMRSELSEAMPHQQFKEIENNITLLMGHMEKGLWANTHSNLQKELEEKQALQEELKRYKEMLDESTECQLTLLEQAADNERQLIDELQEVQVVLERVDSELTDKAIERSELEFELEVWRSTAERLQAQFDESQAIRRQLEAYVLVQARDEELPKQDMEKKDQGMSDRKQQNVMVNQRMQVGEQNTANQNKKALKLSNIADSEQQEQDLLAKELEEAIFGHIMKEKNYTQQYLMLNQIRSEISEAGSKEKSNEKEHNVAYLTKQLQMKNDYLSKVQADLEKEYREKLTAKEELNRYKGMLDDTSKSQLSVMQQAADMEMKLTDELLEAHAVLHRVDSQLTNKTIEGSGLEFELQLWISIAERLNVEVEESQIMRKKLEAYLLAQAEDERMPKKEKNKIGQRMSNIKQQIDDDDKREQELLARELEQAILIHTIKDRNST